MTPVPVAVPDSKPLPGTTKAMVDVEASVDVEANVDVDASREGDHHFGVAEVPAGRFFPVLQEPNSPT